MAAININDGLIARIAEMLEGRPNATVAGFINNRLEAHLNEQDQIRRRMRHERVLVAIEQADAAGLANVETLLGISPGSS